MHDDVLQRCMTATTGMLYENCNRKRQQILARHPGSYAAQQNV
jgi:hypothetical protein